MYITRTRSQMTIYEFRDDHGAQIGLAVPTPDTWLVYGHDYDVQPASTGFLHAYLDTADHVDSAEATIRQHAEAHLPPEPPEPKGWGSVIRARRTGVSGMDDVPFTRWARDAEGLWRSELKGPAGSAYVSVYAQLSSIEMVRPQ